MKYLFKNIGNERIGESQFVEFYTGVNNSMSASKLLPAIEDAVELNILKFLSPDYYDKLQDRFDNDTLSEAESNKIRLLQKAIANYTIVHKITEGSASLSELGLHFRNDDDGNTSTAPQWKEESEKYLLTKKADAYLERFLSFVYDNTESFNAFDLDFDIYFIRNAKELSKYLTIENSLMTFFNLQPSIRKISEQELKPILTTTLYDELLTNVRSDELDEIKTKLLEKVNSWLSPSALLHAIPFLNIDLSTGKLFTVTTNDGFRNRQAARDSQINLLMDQLRNDIQSAKSDLLAFLNENKTDLRLEYDILEFDKVIVSTNSVGLF